MKKVIKAALNKLGLEINKIQKGRKNENIFDEHVTFNDIDVYDDRVLAKGVNSALDETLDAIIDKGKFNNPRVLEIGPKYGFQSKWIDKNLHPKELVMMELPQKNTYINKWIHELKNPHKVIYESLIDSQTLLNEEKFDVIFCTGLLYHTIEHFKILNILRRCLTDNGIMVFQTTIAHRYQDPVILLNLKELDQAGSYALPSKSALFTMLVMTGWSDIINYKKYRPTSNTVLLTCKKSNELPIAYDGLPFGGSKI